MKDFYEKYWTGKLPKMLLFGDPPKWEPKWIKRYLDLISPWVESGDHVVDYGCGEGHFVNIVNCYEDWADIIGVDISEEAIKKARKLYPENQYATLEEYDEIPGHKDVITCFDVMEHIFDFDEVFKFFDYHLKPGGRLIIATNENCFLKMVAIGMFYMDTFFHPYSPHIRFFTRKTLKELLEYKGYRVIHYDRIANHFGFLSTGQFVVAEKLIGLGGIGK